MAWARALKNPTRYQGIALHPSGKKTCRTFPRKRDALAWAEELEATWRRSPAFDPRASEIRFDAWVKLWLGARVVEKETAKKNASHLRVHVLPKWGTWPINAIDRLTVGAWVKEMERAGVGPYTIEGVVRLFSAVMQGAVEAGRLTANPAARQRLPKPAAPLPRYWTREEADRILAELAEPWRTACALDMEVGLRLGELLGLKIGAVDWAAGLISVGGVMTRSGWRSYPKSKRSCRTVPIPPVLMDALRPLIVGRAAGEIVFAGPGGGPVTDVNFRHRVWAPAVALAGACATHRDEGPRVPGCRGCLLTDPGPTGRVRPCPAHRRPVGAAEGCSGCAPVPRETPHCMRHTAASWMVQRGVPLYDVQRLLGHESLATTERYSHLAPDAHDRVRGVWEVPEVGPGASTVLDPEDTPSD